MRNALQKLGPGLLFAGAAIGVSHLVQSTRAGADFGFGLLWALLLVNVFKYPFFQYGPRYALATGESLVDGYKRLGKPVIITYFILTFATMFTIQTAVTIVTASLASSVVGEFKTLVFFGIELTSIKIWTVIILSVSALILVVGRYQFLDRLMKLIVLTLTVSTLIAVVSSFTTAESSVDFKQVFPEASSWVFLIAFMGWMPAPLDISIWHSIWSLEKQKSNTTFNTSSGLFDFNVGYLTALFLGVGFLALGALVMFNSGTSLNTNASQFASQLIHMYTTSLGNWAYVIIAVAALTTMFSTTLTTLDASPRVMERTMQVLGHKPAQKSYHFWLPILVLGSVGIFFFLSTELGTLVQIATVISFLAAPFYAICNYVLMTRKHVPEAWRPKRLMHILSVSGIVFLLGFGLWYVSIL